jgi:integrase
MGMIYKRGAVWWIKYYRDGKPLYETSGSAKHDDAKDLLKRREGDVARGVPVTPKVQRITIDELLADVVTDYKVNGKRSIADLERRIDLHLTPYFGRRRAASITTAEVRRYMEQRQAAEASNAQINRELSALKRAFNLAMQAGKVLARPYIPMLKENNVRTGFFEPADFAKVLRRLPAPLQAVVRFAYLTGWRVASEVLPLQWRQVDFAAGTVRLEPGTTKNDEARTFPLTAELRALLEAQRGYTDAVQKKAGAIIPHVFHRKGKAIKSFRKKWHRACTDAGQPDRIPHDFRRSTVRNLVRAGIPERVAMMLTGHKTRSVFERYNIVSETDLQDAARRLDAAAGTSR